MRKKHKLKKVYTKSDIILHIIFIILAITVVSLFIYYLTMDKPQEISNEISLPLITEEPITTSISLSQLNEESIDTMEYLFQVANHSNNEINKELKYYNIEILNASNYNIEIELLKLVDEEYEKVTLSDTNISDNLSFNSEEQENHNYKIIINSSDEFEEFSFIGLSINPITE